MKLLSVFFVVAAFSVVPIVSVRAQDDHKHPHLNGSGHVMDSTGAKLGWIKDGVIYNATGEKIGKIEKQELFDYKGHKLGKIGEDGTFYDVHGTVIYTIESNSKGEKCKVFDPNGKVVATVHDGYKNQACAIHCLTMKMPPH